ncbi:hypothetical protein [Jiella pelagia]|uniref:Uncharacterized protein n=1 Tax=Jiella pelagia TaxID=2986949 RepID=A0ABY7BZP7_9HYPH|nr:hypothetical protein [Jiella pelagia]WAP69054.1 hypothetical protein OH818_01585 [Jiella pelagia]
MLSWFDWSDALGYGLGIVGLITSYIFYRRSKNVQRLRYTVYRRPLIDIAVSEHVKDRTVVVDGRVVPALYRDYVLLYSSGNRSFRFAEHINSITAALKPDEIIEAGILVNDDPANLASIELKDGSLTISVDYLRSGDGILFFIDHTNKFARKEIKVDERERDAVSRVDPYDMAAERETIVDVTVFLVFVIAIGALISVAATTFPSEENGFNSTPFALISIALPVLFAGHLYIRRVLARTLDRLSRSSAARDSLTRLVSQLPRSRSD